MHPDLEALLALQDRDVAVAGCDARLQALDPELRAGPLRHAPRPLGAAPARATHRVVTAGS